MKWLYTLVLSSVQFIRSVMSNSLRSLGLHHARPLWPSPTPGIYSNSCLLSRWCYPAITFFVSPFSHLQSFPASGSFQMNQFFTTGSLSIGVSASASDLTIFRTDYSGLISFRVDWLDTIAVQGTLKSSPTPQFKSINSLALSFLYSLTLTSIYD